MQPQWEYKSIEVLAGGFFGNKVDREKLDVQLNELGRDGWELVDALSTSQYDGQTRSVIAVFKRPR